MASKEAVAANHAFSEGISERIIKADVGSTVTHQIGDGPDAKQFIPTRYERPDHKYEEKINTAINLRPLGKEIFGENVPDSFYEYGMKKKEAAETAKYYDYLLRSTNPNDTRAIEKLKSLYPNIFNEPLKVFDDIVERQKQWFRIKVFGCESKEDFELKYAVATGSVEEPDVDEYFKNRTSRINPAQGFLKPDIVNYFKGAGIGQRDIAKRQRAAGPYRAGIREAFERRVREDGDDTFSIANLISLPRITRKKVAAPEDLI